jgi:hypothetical protein
VFKFVDPSPVYLVAFHTMEPVEPDPHDEDDVFSSDVKNIVICRNMHAVGDAIHSRKDGLDWAIFEVVDDHTERRAIIYESDGRTVKGIE